MLLKKIIKNLPEEKKKIVIKGLAIDSKQVKKNYIFFAIKGNKFDGEKFIFEAVKNGAIAVVCSKVCKYKNKKITIIKSSDVRSLLSKVCSKFYSLKPKNIIAVTGTNGKTSVSDLFYQILNNNNIRVASIGTLGVKYDNKISKTTLTSPDTIDLHKILEKLKKIKIENVIIEASSHGLHQKRINDLNLKAGIFTNFSQDHLDYHKTMKSYLNSKLILFKEILSKNKAIITDNSLREFSILKKISKKRNLKLIDINKITKKIQNSKIKELSNFQQKNLSMAILAAKICKIKEQKIFKSLNKIKDVNGRLELIRKFPNNVKIYVDFAHTPDALQKIADTLKVNHGKNISIVFGCGGNRDFKKRPIMAKIASSNFKKIYVTDDNPRNEKPEKIRKEIIKNIKNKNCFNIGSRSKAIKLSVLNAEPNEVILVAGKGHEQEQIYKNKIFSISDKQIIKKLKLKIKKKTDKEKNFSQNVQIFKKLKKIKKIENFQGIAIDSREVKKDNLFLTIKGKNNDGSNFISEAIKKGAKYIISSKKIKFDTKKIIRVSNEIKFLNNFASAKRNKSNAKVLAITGSAGKTSLKNILNDLLKNFGNTFCSPKSYNNHFGVPLSLSSLKFSDRYGIFEVGMSKAGEIDSLTRIIKPHIAVITNVGEAHIENFKNLKGIANAKGEIIDNIEKNGTIILNRDDKFFLQFTKKAKKRKLNIMSFGMSVKADIHPVEIIKNKKNIKLKVKIFNQTIKLLIENINIYNVLSSLAVVKSLNLDFNKIIKNFRYLKPSEGRGKIHIIKRYKKKFTLIDESYNANPLSVKKAIENFNTIKKKNSKKYLLLGDMLELGSKSDIFHKNLSKVINNSDIDKVFIKGNHSLITYKNINKKKRGNILQQEEDVDFTLNNNIANNDYLMIKGSNATGLNNFSKKIIKGL